MNAPLRIMIVDDEPDIRTVNRLLLKNEYEVVEAENGLDALTKLEDYEPDLLLIDVMMPIMNGWDLAKGVRVNEHFKDIPILFLTSLSGTDDIKKGYEVGANVYLTKPVDAARLKRNILSFIEHDHLRARPKRRTLEELARNEADASKRIAEHSAERSKRSAEAAPPAAAVTGPAKNPPRILVIDDDPATIDSAATWIGEGYEVVPQRRGIDFLRKIPRYEPDLLLMGGQSPQANGIQLLNIVRRCQATAMIPVLYILPKQDSRQMNYVLGQGADLVVAKPLNPVELRIQVKRIASQVGFRVRWPKQIPIDQLLEQERSEAAAHKSEDELVEMLDKEGAGGGGRPAAPGQDTAKKVRDFYREHGKKD